MSARHDCFLPHHSIGLYMGCLSALPSSHQLTLTYYRSQMNSETINSCKVMYYLTGRKLIPLGKNAVGNVFCSLSNSQIINVCVCNHFGPYSKACRMQSCQMGGRGVTGRMKKLPPGLGDRRPDIEWRMGRKPQMVGACAMTTQFLNYDIFK